MFQNETKTIYAILDIKLTLIPMHANVYQYGWCKHDAMWFKCQHFHCVQKCIVKT